MLPRIFHFKLTTIKLQLVSFANSLRLFLYYINHFRQSSSAFISAVDCIWKWVITCQRPFVELQCGWCWRAFVLEQPSLPLLCLRHYYYQICFNYTELTRTIVIVEYGEQRLYPHCSLNQHSFSFYCFNKANKVQFRVQYGAKHCENLLSTAYQMLVSRQDTICTKSN